MKFTDSPVIELTVNGTLLSIQQDNSTMHVGTSVWPCSLVLAKFAERWSATDSSSPSPSPNPYAELLHFRRRRAVELGTGCGVAGMAFHLLGLTEIVLTDVVQVMPALKHNLKRNKAALGKLLKTSVVSWSNRDQISALNPPFDLVIAADVVYIEESVGQLVAAMESLMKEDGAVLLGYQIRSPEADKLFWELCDAVFRIEKVPHEHLHAEYAYEEADVYIFRKKAKKSESE
ncbi:S-adenosyl-L-methionine-dependent methyltransferases superfamily protein [Raphanus sativus]|uniref:Uncharacterized protein LOC108834755 n=1 Tax=Raphanus sativus TaxID=3726 RepID=A0A6J0LUQ7_RAPSA|nr:uncharacterized protein LOC108834755 [Raphanus sativus]KAJ4878224.1 S-adenosyl-L-methionine-dependent methyltransferases superfamily protein [Raphanus sativus]